MVKLVFCLTRLPHLSREEFQRYWRERHGPLVRESARRSAFAATCRSTRWRRP